MSTTLPSLTTIPTSIFEDMQAYSSARSHPSDGAVLLLWLACEAARHALDEDHGQHAVARASINDMVDATGLSATHVKDVLKTLEELEYISYEPRRGTKSRITLLWIAEVVGHNESDDADTFEVQGEEFDDVTQEDDEAYEYLGEELAELTNRFERQRRHTQSEIHRLDEALRQTLSKIDALTSDATSEHLPATQVSPSAAKTTEPAAAPVRGRRVDWSAREARLLKHVHQLIKTGQGQSISPRELRQRLQNIEGWSEGTITATIKRLLKSGVLKAKGHTNKRRYFLAKRNASTSHKPADQTKTPVRKRRPRVDWDAREALVLEHLRLFIDKGDGEGARPGAFVEHLLEHVPSLTRGHITQTIRRLLDAGRMHAQGATIHRRYVLPESSADAGDGDEPSVSGHLEQKTVHGQLDETAQADRTTDETASSTVTTGNDTKDLATPESEPDQNSQDDNLALTDTNNDRAPGLEQAWVESVLQAYDELAQGRGIAVVVSDLWYKAGEPPAQAFLAWLVGELDAGRALARGQGARVQLGNDPTAVLHHQGQNWGLVKFVAPQSG